MFGVKEPTFPREGFGTSHAQRLLSRKAKTNFPTSSNLLRPSVAEDTLKKDKLRKLTQEFHYGRSANDLQDLQKDDVFRLNEKTWRMAKELKPLDRRSYVKWSALYQKSETPETFCRG